MLKPTVAFFAALMAAGTANAENVEIYVVDMLDNIQNGYCIDIAKGRGADANPENGLQAHTCYSPSGEVLVDQAFDPTSSRMVCFTCLNSTYAYRRPRLTQVPRSNWPSVMGPMRKAGLLLAKARLPRHPHPKCA